MLINFAQFGLLFLSVITTIFLGLTVFFKDPNKKVNIAFLLFALSVSLWSFTNFFVDVVSEKYLLLAIKAEFVFVAFLCYFFVIFARNFSTKQGTKKTTDIFFIVPILIFSAITIFSDLIIVGYKTFPGGIDVVYGALENNFYLLEILLAVYLGLFGIIPVVYKYIKSKGLIKKQLQFLLLGIVIMVVFATITNLVLPNFVDKSEQIFTILSRLGVYSTLFFVGTTSYAIIKHRLMDIRLVVARTVTYSILVTLIAVFYIGSTILISNTLLSTTTTNGQLTLYTVLTLIVAFTFQPMRRFLEEYTDKIFFKGAYDSNNLLSGLTKIMAETILIDDIAHNLLKRLIENMRITRGAFVLTDAGKIFVSETQGYKEEPKFSEKDIFSLQALDKDLVFEEIEEGPAKEMMRKLNVTVVIPLKTQVDHVGILLLGEKASGEIYSEKDIKVLEIFAPEAAISFENAKSVEKIRRFNITLKEQVERATKQLRDANEQLKDLDKLKDEFLSIASHDLRTPMTAIKGYLWMALNDRAGKIENPALKRYLDISYASSERMISLINDLLNVSRIKAGRMQMIFENIDFKQIVDQVFAELASKSTEKSIELKYEGDPKVPHVIADKQKMAEVLQNLVGNSLKFTPEKGKITVNVKPSKESGFVEVAVSDTGVGLSKEDASKLFEKFARVEQSYKSAKTTGGTGLGLYITKNYTEMHGGKIWVTSELGKGTTFTFTLKVFDKAVLDKMSAENQKKEVSAAIPQTTTSMAKEAVVNTAK